MCSFRKKRLHPSGSPVSSLNETQSTDVLKHGDGNLDRRGSTAATSVGTPSQQSLRAQQSLRTLNSDMEGSGGQLLGSRSSDLGEPYFIRLNTLQSTLTLHIYEWKR